MIPARVIYSCTRLQVCFLLYIKFETEIGLTWLEYLTPSLHTPYMSSKNPLPQAPSQESPERPFSPSNQKSTEAKHERPFSPSNQKSTEAKHERPFSPSNQKSTEAKHERPFSPSNQKSTEAKHARSSSPDRVCLFSVEYQLLLRKLLPNLPAFTYTFGSHCHTEWHIHIAYNGFPLRSNFPFISVSRHGKFMVGFFIDRLPSLTSGICVLP